MAQCMSAGNFLSRMNYNRYIICSMYQYATCLDCLLEFFYSDSFYRASAYCCMLTRDIDIVILSVRLSACPSVRDTLVLYENGLTYRHSFFTIHFHHHFFNHSSFTGIKHLHEIQTGSPPAGPLNTGGV